MQGTIGLVLQERVPFSQGCRAFCVGDLKRDPRVYRV